jgi:hypothetical protein
MDISSPIVAAAAAATRCSLLKVRHACSSSSQASLQRSEGQRDQQICSTYVTVVDQSFPGRLHAADLQRTAIAA